MSTDRKNDPLNVPDFDSNPAPEDFAPLITAMRDSSLPRSIFENVTERLAQARWERLERDRLRDELAKERRSHEHCRDWYAVRIERITDLAKEHGIWPEVATVLANGTTHDAEPPTYAQILNQERHKVSALRADNAMVREGAEEWRLAKIDADHLLHQVRDHWPEDVAPRLFEAIDAYLAGGPTDD